MITIAEDEADEGLVVEEAQEGGARRWKQLNR